MNYKTLASPDIVLAVSEALRKRNIEPITVANRAEALATIKSLIPKGASITNGASTTLEEIGYFDYLKSDQHGWNNLQDGIAAETDPVKRAKLRRQASTADYYLGSVHALTQAGELLIGSGTGSQLPSIVFNAEHVIFVVGAQKIVPTLEEAMRRLNEYVFSLEDAKMRAKYGKGTLLGKIVIFNNESQLNGRKIHLILVNEVLGY